MLRILKFLLAIVLLPFTFWVALEDGLILLGVVEHLGAAISFLLGAAIYAAIHYKYYNFSRPYVLVHEITHAVAAILCCIRIKDVNVGQDSGYVKMSRTNTFVVLAPYFVPGYVVLIALIYLFLGCWVDLTPYRQVFLFAVGFFMAFHFIQTFHTLWEADQPDLKLAGGKFFSCVTSILVNLVVLAIVLKILFPQEVFLLESVRRVAAQAAKCGQIIVHYILGLFNKPAAL